MAKQKTVTRQHLKAPVLKIKPVAWVRENLFNTWYNSLLSVLIIVALWVTLPPFIQWAFIDSLWNSSAQECRNIDGACWSLIPNNIKFIFLGFFPSGQEWRPLLAMVILLSLVIYSRERARWQKKLLWFWIIAIIVMGSLMHGGIFGMPVVDTAQWSGLPLTLMLSFFGMIAAYPLGVLLALGRRSTMPAIKSLCVVYIEMIRGVPLISLLFMSSVMFPLFLPDGVTIDKVPLPQNLWVN
jgi:general L-amino acid transport system permease protein